MNINRFLGGFNVALQWLIGLPDRVRHPGAVICFNCGRTFAPRFARLKARLHQCEPTTD
jgi:hypothetical protein